MTNPPNSSNRLTADTVKTRIGVLTFEKGISDRGDQEQGL